MIILQKNSKYDTEFHCVLQAVFINASIFNCHSRVVKTKKLTLVQLLSTELKAYLCSRQIDISKVGTIHRSGAEGHWGEEPQVPSNRQSYRPLHDHTLSINP